MKITNTTVKIDRILHNIKSQAVIEGKLTPPLEYSDLASIMFVNGKIIVEKVEPGENKILIEGKSLLTTVYIGNDDIIYSFDSETDFSHSILADEVDKNTICNVKAALKDIEYNLTETNSIAIRCIVDIECKPYKSVSKDYIKDAVGNDIMVKQCNPSTCYLSKKATDTLSYKQEIRIPQNMPKAKQLLYSDSFIKLNNTIIDGSKCVLEGDLNVYIMYLSNDDISPIHYIYETLDFGKIAYIEGLDEEDTVDVVCNVKSFCPTLIQDDSDTINIQAELCFEIYVYKNNKTEVVCDAYSLSKVLNIEKQTQSYMQLCAKGHMKSIIRTSVEIDENMPPVARVLFFNAKPLMTSGYCEQDRIYIEGIMLYNACYSSSDGTKSIKGEFAFTTQVQIDGFQDNVSPEICIDVDYINFDGAGRNIDLKITLYIEAKGYDTKNICGIVNMEETPEDVKQLQGMHIYFANKNESYWDIAKKYNTSVHRIEKYNAKEKELIDITNKKIIIF